MQIIRNQIAIPVSQGKAILVHTLTGGMFVLGAVEYQILNNWVNKGEVVPQTPEEKTFYQLLQDNKFLTGSEEQEKAMEQETLEQSRAQYRKAQELLDSVAFVLTYQCNFRCPYCYEGNGDCNISSQNRSIMTPEMVDAIFAIHQNKIENIMLYGGEPLLPVNKETICHIISKAPNANFSATTNGYYLEEYFDIFSKLTINHLMVTLDGEESLHNKTRILHDGKGTYEKIMRGIDLYLRHDIRIKIRMNISKANVQSCLLVKKKLIEQYKDQHSRGLLLFEMQPIFQTTGKSRQELTQILYYPDAAENSAGGPKPLDARENTIAGSLSPLVVTLFIIVKNRKNSCNMANERFLGFAHPHQILQPGRLSRLIIDSIYLFK